MTNLDRAREAGGERLRLWTDGDLPPTSPEDMAEQVYRVMDNGELQRLVTALEDILVDPNDAENIARVALTPSPKETT